jgi:triphosphatase
MGGGLKSPVGGSRGFAEGAFPVLGPSSTASHGGLGAGMAKTPREVELKFALPRDQASEVAGAIGALADAPARRLNSVYFDTPKGALKRKGLTLRVRREDGGRFVQTLKEGGDGLGRGEWEAKVKGPCPDLAVLRATPAGEVLARSAKLAPTFEVDVRRRSIDMSEAGSVIEVSLDEGVARAGNDEVPFSELELELKSGPHGGLFTLARRVAAAGDLTLSFTAKAERGAAVGAGRSAAVKFRPPALSRDLSSGEAFQKAAMACLRQITANAERLRRRPSPEVIHQLRVGLRRLRSLITSFKSVVSDARLPAIKAELKWLTGELDAARNLDVLLHGGYRAALAQKQDAGGVKDLGRRLRAARALAYARCASAIEGERFRRLLVDVFVWIWSGPWTQARETAEARERPIRRQAAKELERRRRKITRQGERLRELEPEVRHKLRIQAKKLRYSADIFVGLFSHPKRAKAFIETLKKAQDALGELNDIVVGEQLARETAIDAALPGMDSAFVAGRITGAQKARVGPLTDEAEEALAAFRRAKPFWS